MDIAQSFSALRVHKEDSITHSRVEDISLDDLNAGEVVIQAHWSGVNYKDALAVSGRGRIMKKFPCVAGIDVSGEVVRSSSDQFSEGQKVLVTGCNIGESRDGGYAQYVRVPANAVIALPDGMTLQNAMAIGTAGFTAAFALRRMLENHQTPEMGPIAVTGPTGGVGSIAVDIFTSAGFEVHAVTGKPEAEEYLKKLGTHTVVDRKSAAVVARPLESAVWGGAVDNLGGDTLSWLTRTVKPWGNIASIGLAQSHELETTVMPFILRGVSILGIHSVECPRQWREDIWQKLATEWKPKHLDLIVSQIVNLQGIAEACDKLIAGKITGRVLVDLRGDTLG